MQLHFNIYKKYFSNKKHLTICIVSLLIGIIVISTGVLYNNVKKKKANSFKTLSDDFEASSSGDIAGVFDEAPTSTPSPTLHTYFQTYPTPTHAFITQKTVTSTPTSSGSTGTSSTTSNPTSTPAPQPTSNPTPATNTSTPTTIPTVPPSAPTPTPTPKPTLHASISTNIDSGTLHVTISADKSLLVCIIHYYDKNGVPADGSNGNISGNQCASSAGNADSIEKITANLASKEVEGTVEVEKHSPF